MSSRFSSNLIKSFSTIVGLSPSLSVTDFLSSPHAQIGLDPSNARVSDLRKLQFERVLVLKSETLALLGSSPICAWGEDRKSVTLKLGDNPTIVENDLIKFDENLLLIDDDECSSD
jgi:hypothetical protein